MSRVLTAAPLMLNEQSNILTSTEKPITSKADPPDRGLHRTQARRPRVPCDSGLQLIEKSNIFTRAAVPFESPILEKADGKRRSFLEWKTYLFY